MNKLNSLQDSSFGEYDSNEEYESNDKLEKILCNHCGRSISNGIRCQGICVADNEY